jgi:hypothetical protein
MGVRSGSLVAAVAAVAAIGGIALVAQAGAGTPPRTQITVWAASPGLYGGARYGGAPTTGAMITEQRDLDLAGGEARAVGVAATIDPASVQLRDVTDPDAVVLEQRFVPAAATPTELLARHLGASITVVTPRGEVSGALRAVDDQVLVVEVGAGEQRHLQVLRRDGYVQEVRLPARASPAGDPPSLVWRVRTTKPGKHTVELSYRADGLSWTADYLAVVDEASKSLELSARATIKNATGASFDGAELTLITGSAAVQRRATARPAPPAMRYVVPTAVRIAAGDAVQVELIPRRAAPARSVIMYEAMDDPSEGFQLHPGTDCAQYNGAEPGSGRAEVALELDVPAPAVLPDGKVRLFRRHAGHLELMTEEPLRTGVGVARIGVAAAGDVTGERHAVTCNYDEHTHTIQETVELKLENKARQAADVIVREYLWRWPVWHFEAEDHKGVRAGPQTQEYHLHVPGNGSQRITYTVVYTW